MSAPAHGGSGAQGAAGGPPYAPHNASLGGVPDITPDIPATSVFLFLYVVFAIVHIKIFKMNKDRGHKFIFSGAIFGFSMIRIVTMSLRIAWACHQRNISLGIAAQVFVYVGTVILFIINWFFTQRIVRAQHPGFGWSKPYRILHRAAIVCLILCLLMLVVAAIQQFFTLNTKTLRIDRDLQPTGQTYFAVFCFAPIILLTLSLIVPRRRGTEKFGAGRLKNNISILVIAVLILSAGQFFRCVTTWLPPVPLRNARGQPLPSPWYFSKACFYTFNFTTEILVVILYAILRVDLRFHVPDGSTKAGDYSRKRIDSQYHIGVIGDESKLKRTPTTESMRSIRSNKTLHEYEESLFEDTRTLADSLRYPSTILAVDPKNGHWKLKNASQSASTSSLHHFNRSRSSSLWDPKHDSFPSEPPPPMPGAPMDWPLRESQLPPGQIPVLEHRNRSSSFSAGFLQSAHFSTPDIERGDALNEAIQKLEANSASKQPQPPNYDAIEPCPKKNRDSLGPKGGFQPHDDIPRKHVYSPSSPQPTYQSKSELPKKHDYSAHRTSTPSTSFDLPKKYNYAPPVETRSKETSPPLSSHSGGGASFSTEGRREAANAEREFARFSFEASPSINKSGASEREYERRYGG